MGQIDMKLKEAAWRLSILGSELGHAADLCLESCKPGARTVT
jgi:hypothetical protein